MRSVAFAMLLGACGRYGFTAAPDAARDAVADAVADAIADAPADAARVTYRELVLSDAPMAYWRLGDAGATAHDEVGAFDGTYTGNCTFGAPGAIVGDPDTAVTFDGASCRVGFAPGAFDFSGMAAFTVEAWITTAADAIFRFVFSNETRSGPNPVDGYGLLVAPTGIELERVISSNNGATPPAAIGAAYIHVVGVYDGGSLLVYENGVVVGAKSDVRAANATTISALIGASSAGNFFKGSIDEVAIYPSALAAARIAAHYHKGITP